MYNVKEIHKFLNKRENDKIEIYDTILDKCFKRIESAVLNNYEFTLFIVPDFIIGKPAFNFENCIKFLIFRLKKNGFLIKYYYPNALQIIWGKKDFNPSNCIEDYKPSKLQNNLIENKKSNITFNFSKDNRKNKKKKDKFKKINNFIPRTNIFKDI